MKKEMPAWLVLAIIMLVAALSLAGTNLITKGPIEEQQVLNAENARKAVLSDAELFEPFASEEELSIDQLFVGKKGDEVVGYVGVITAKGYGGDIEVTAGVMPDGTITGISVGGASFAETAGLGAKAKEPAFMDQFQGKVAPLKVIKQGEASGESTIDSITAATITTNAVTRGVNNIVKQVQDLFKAPVDLGGFKAGTTVASVQGFAGPVVVEVTFDENKTITDIKIGDDSFAETTGLGDKVLAPEFAQMLVGKTAPLAIGDIDAVSGATITSQAVVDAINAGIEQLSSGGGVFQAGTATASVQGFGGPVAVEVTFDESQAITDIKIGDDNFAETKGLGDKVLTPEFAQMLLGKVAPLSIGDIDVVSGATITSEAVVEAINAAFEQLMTGGGEASSEESDSVESEPKTDDAAESVESYAPASDALTASAQGFAGPVLVEVSFDENMAITGIKIGDESFAETKGLGDKVLTAEFAKMLVGKTAPLTLEDIDAIAGATVTSQAVVDAVNACAEQLTGEGVVSDSAESETDSAESVEPVSGTSTASVQGFGGPVVVVVTFDENKTITDIKIGDDSFAETKDLGAKALAPEFAQMLVGKTVPLALEDIDAIAHATVTSQAVVDAINAAYEQLLTSDDLDVQESVVDSDDNAESVESVKSDVATAFKGGMASATAKGGVGPVTVLVAFNGDKAITVIKIGDESFVETEGLGAKALEPEFGQMLIGKVAPLTLEDIDAISGATFTSKAVVEAINAALEKLMPEEVIGDGAAFEPGTYTATAQGFGGPVTVEVTFDENKTITDIKIGDEDFAETKGLGDKVLAPEFAQMLIGKTAPLTIEDIDAISHATVTSEAVVQAINTALEAK